MMVMMMTRMMVHDDYDDDDDDIDDIFLALPIFPHHENRVTVASALAALRWLCDGVGDGDNHGDADLVHVFPDLSCRVGF